MDLDRLKGRIVFVAGMSRAGTTFLYHNLQKHPQIFVAGRKEVCYFAHNYRKGPAWFASFYQDLGAEQTAFDICGLYFMHPNVPERIARFDSEAKVIIGVRDPSTWIFSLYEQYQDQFDVPPFSEFLEGCVVQREGTGIRLSFSRHQLEHTIERFRETFGDRLLLYDFGILGEDPLHLLRTIERFAGLPPYFTADNFTNARINARGRRRIPLLDNVMHLPGVANLVGRVLPRSLVLKARTVLDARSVRRLPKSRDREAPTYSEEELARVEQLFAPDRQYVHELFGGGPIVLNAH